MARIGSDSRSVVVEHQRAADMLAHNTAPMHNLTAEQYAKIGEIAKRPLCDEAKLQAALREVGNLTACDFAVALQISVPHARLSELRKAGVPVMPVGWVRQLWGTRTRVLKLYSLGGG